MSQLDIPCGHSRIPNLAGLFGRGWHDAVRIVTATVLLTAAGMKGYQLATRPLTGQGMLDSRWLLMAIVEGELTWALLLLSGLWVGSVRRITIMVFIGFATMALYKALSGDSSCGCFGTVKVKPWVTLVLDLLVVGAFLRFRSSPRKFTQRQLVSRSLIVVGGMLIIGGPAVWVMTSFKPASFDGEGIIRSESNLVVLEPEKWIGKNLPLLEYIDMGNELTQGNWLMVLYRHDCSHCQAAIPKYIQQAETVSLKNGTGVRVALVELPPFEEGLLKRNDSESLLWGRLKSQYDWFVQTPVEIKLQGGRVIACTYPEDK